MLYEVITDFCTFCCFFVFFLIQYLFYQLFCLSNTQFIIKHMVSIVELLFVITSYSIHYTKLYEHCQICPGLFPGLTARGNDAPATASATAVAGDRGYVYAAFHLGNRRLRHGLYNLFHYRSERDMVCVPQVFR